MAKEIFRARYTGGKGAWVTTVFRRTKKEAEDDIKMFANPKRHGFTGVKIFSMDKDSFIKKHQRVPRF